MRIVVTGAAGNLGSKLVAHLETCDWVEHLIAIDIVPEEPTSDKTEWLVANLADASNRPWVEKVREADAIVHYAALSASSHQTWQHAAASFDMTLNLLENIGDSDRRYRFVFASSNHVMGGYKDVPLPDDGKLRGETPPLAGTRYLTPNGYRWGSAYSATKLFGERACIARAQATKGRVSAVCIRIGWCQDGENDAASLTAFGLSGHTEPPDEERKNLEWFRNMWLSNRDHTQLMERALRADAYQWPTPAIVVAGMSGNTGMPWAIDETRSLLGYEPMDDMRAELERAAIVQGGIAGAMTRNSAPGALKYPMPSKKCAPAASERPCVGGAGDQ